ncbi:outer membrane biogenesis protein BamB [Rosistilla ulvae]|uniref:Outer membrane biogenesis protein BamB n=1 Tax=Rosistilla ulvae TaxID=1930277 RepID=A0A517LW73_9BACT|nr:PQQ-binding-like beta-propeller repeat protein [Rosistilla ulvae]QDS86873.1 outer membrane biogenesis protein BamB [Rosistilla ulvae]
MSDDVTPENEPAATDATAPPARKPGRKPVILVALTLLFAAFTIGGRYFIIELEDLVGISMDVLNVITLFGTAALLLGWAGWALLMSGWRWPQRIAVAVMLIGLPIGFLSLFRPVGGGDIDFLRFEPVWTKRAQPAALTDDAAVVTVDLKTETPNDFAQFLGREQTGSVDAQIDPEKFADSPILWKQTIGLGWPGFVARNGFAVTMEQRGVNECVSCYRIDDGTLVWLYEHPARHRDAMNLGHVGPRSTPTIHDGKVYAVGAVGNLVCLDGADGTPLWQVDLNELLEIELAETTDNDGLTVQYEANTSLAWGRSNSPLIVDDSVIIAGGGPREGTKATLMAFDLQTGELKWRGGDEMIAYGSPTIAAVSGIRQILMTAESQAMGFDPKTGDVLWTFERSGDSDGGANTSQLSVVSETDVMTTKGYPGGGGERIRLSVDGEKITPESVWYNASVLKTKLTSPVIYDGHGYSLSNGFMESTDLSDGTRNWKQRGRFGHGQILLVGDKILIHSESGTLHLIDASPEEYHEYGEIKTIDGICWNTLCLYGSKLLVRSDLEAACIDLPMLNQPAVDAVAPENPEP